MRHGRARAHGDHASDRAGAPLFAADACADFEATRAALGIALRNFALEEISHDDGFERIFQVVNASRIFKVTKLSGKLAGLGAFGVVQHACKAAAGQSVPRAEM